ncbi:hypothetical protein NM688_g7913 [Phlebia brevispora]|uniref:Uncharacterized protein n=1 Tax=Phlebia brevispora TaxID=194682 RepID=A0ACC1RZP2_9APHY|nr:hypothetical protein NM688_g7913 [Phlebia brevispora]
MADQDDEPTIKVKVGGTTIELPERKVRRELDRFGIRLRRELFRAQEFLEEAGLSSLLAPPNPRTSTAASASTGPTGPDIETLSTAGTEALPPYSAPTQTVADIPSGAAEHTAESTSLSIPTEAAALSADGTADVSHVLHQLHPPDPVDPTIPDGYLDLQLFQS